MKNNLNTSLDSPKNNMPKTITPTAPIAVQQAYAVPIGIDSKETDKKNKLKIMNITTRIVKKRFEKLFENLRAKTQAISNSPAITKIIQEFMIQYLTLQYNNPLPNNHIIIKELFPGKK